MNKLTNSNGMAMQGMSLTDLEQGVKSGLNMVKEGIEIALPFITEIRRQWDLSKSYTDKKSKFGTSDWGEYCKDRLGWSKAGIADALGYRELNSLLVSIQTPSSAQFAGLPSRNTTEKATENWKQVVSNADLVNKDVSTIERSQVKEFVDENFEPKKWVDPAEGYDLNDPEASAKNFTWKIMDMTVKQKQLNRSYKFFVEGLEQSIQIQGFNYTIVKELVFEMLKTRAYVNEIENLIKEKV